MVSMLTKFATLALPLFLILAPCALAKIENIVFPTTATAGQTIQAQVSNYNYIQNWDDFGIIFGYCLPQFACEGCVGDRIGYFNNFDASVDGTAYGGDIPLTGQNPYLIDIKIPDWTTSGEYVLIAAVPYLVGASGITDIHYWSGNITITDSGSA